MAIGGFSRPPNTAAPLCQRLSAAKAPGSGVPEPGANAGSRQSFDKKANDIVVASEVWPFVLSAERAFERVRLDAFHHLKINDRIMKSKNAALPQFGSP